MVESDWCKLTTIWAAAFPNKHHDRRGNPSDSVKSANSQEPVDP